VPIFHLWPAPGGYRSRPGIAYDAGKAATMKQVHWGTAVSALRSSPVHNSLKRGRDDEVCFFGSMASLRRIGNLAAGGSRGMGGGRC
jgi:hypothetical protein